MQKEIPYITLIEAPYGYGKTFNVNKLIKEYKILNILYVHQNDNFINSLIKTFHINKFDCPLTSDFTDWYKYFKDLKYELLIAIDDFDRINDVQALEFFNFFIINKLPNIHFIITTSHKLDLEPKLYLSENLIITQKSTVIKENEFKRIWDQNSLKINKNDIDFYNNSGGWPLIIELYLRLKKNIIDRNTFNKDIEKAHKILFNIDNLFADSNKLVLEKKLIDKYFLSDLNYEYLIKTNKQYIDYWIYVSLYRSDSIEDSITYLLRALKICLAEKLNDKILRIYNRLINFYTINSDYLNIDLMIKEALKYLDFSSNSEVAVYKYLKANRLRQNSKYNQALNLLEEIIDTISNEETFLKFNTKSLVLYGLIQYQIGNYEITKNYYKKALALSKNEGNKVLETEITIMSAFLDTWEGKDNNNLSLSIIDTVEGFPIKDQPMMWLNLAFYWILGEKINIEYVELVLNKIEIINQQLKYNFLIPLIADIKARVLRYKGEYESAFYYHKLTLNNLENESFEYIHAKLNMALSLIKVSNNNEAEVLINDVYKKSLESNSLGLAKEAEILLEQLNSKKYPKKITLNIVENNIINTEKSIDNIRFDFFGNFNGFINNEVIKWNRKKAKHLIINLILSSGGIHREHLAELLFPDDDNPIKNLDVHIHLIRKIFDRKNKEKINSIIIFQNSSYFINKDIVFASDIKEFNNKYNIWQSETNESIKVRLSQELSNIYKDDFLNEIDFFELWVAERESYRKKIIEVLIYLCKSNINENIEYYCQRLIDIEPYIDDNYILVMNTIYTNKNMLKGIFKKYSNTMNNDLLISPNEYVVELYNYLLKK